MIRRVLSQLHVKTCRGVCENASKKAKSAVLAFKYNISQTKKRTCIQIYTTIKITYDIKPSKFEVSLQCSLLAIQPQSWNVFFGPPGTWAAGASVPMQPIGQMHTICNSQRSLQAPEHNDGHELQRAPLRSLPLVWLHRTPLMAPQEPVLQGAPSRSIRLV